MFHSDNPVSRLQHRLSWSWNLLNVAIGMTGLRLDRWRNPTVFVPWTACWLACWGLFYATFEFHIILKPGAPSQRVALIYTAVVWLLYYVLFLSVALSSPLRRVLINRFGANHAYTLYEAMLGVVFLNQGLSQIAVMKAYEVSLTTIPSWALLTIGAGLIGLGFFCKAWATYLTGLDTYYYRDMFLGHGTASPNDEPFVVSGPFRFVDNPMYGVGNLQAYGGAVWFGSWQGLVVSFIFQASIYAFYFLFERPFVVKTYKP